MCARNEATLTQAAESIRRYGVEVLAEAFDVTQAPAVRGFVEKVAARFGGVDICVTNAGGPPAKDFWRRAMMSGRGRWS